MDIAPEKVEEMRISSRGVPAPNIQALKNLGIDVNASNNELFKQGKSSSADEGWDNDGHPIPVQKEFPLKLKIKPNIPSITKRNPNYDPDIGKKKGHEYAGNLGNEYYGVQHRNISNLLRNNVSTTTSQQVGVYNNVNTGIKRGGADLKETNLLIYLFNLYYLLIL